MKKINLKELENVSGGKIHIRGDLDLVARDPRNDDKNFLISGLNEEENSISGKNDTITKRPDIHTS